MPGAGYVEQVERARAGDPDAFAALVARFQDVAVGTALGWLGDIELARDAAQEAFADAHRLLCQLDEPAAFPGWLRRIVLKHCDRITRRVRPPLAPLREAEPASADPATASGSDPEARMARREERERVRLALEALPPAERLPLVLHYFAGESQPEVAALLELPLSTVKKRLRSARQRLREHGESLMQETLESLRPSRGGDFSDQVALFLAIRGGDRRRVAELLDRRPELLEAHQDWDPDLVWRGVLPFANRATPLITAVERGDAALVELLLERGAAADGACGCPTGEAALWTAVLQEQASIAGLLLQHGADPNRLAAAGNAALHVAALRGSAEMVSLLLEHGADAELCDRGGRNALEWARIKGHDAVARLLAPTADETTTADRPGAEHTGISVIETGVKALDLFAPLAPGALACVPFQAGVGMVVLLTELAHNWARRAGTRVVWTGFQQGPYDPRDLEAELSETGIRSSVEVHVASAAEPPTERRAAFERGLARALSARDAGEDVLLIVQQESGFEADVESSYARLSRSDARITTLVITPFVDGQRAPRDTLAAPFDALIAFDRRRAVRKLFPAIDPRSSRSRALDRDVVGARHVDLAERARALLADYVANADPDLGLAEPDGGTDSGSTTAHRARHLIAFLTQPFQIAEPFSAHPGAEVPLANTLDGVERILDGPLPTDPPPGYRGVLP